MILGSQQIGIPPRQQAQSLWDKTAGSPLWARIRQPDIVEGRK